MEMTFITMHALDAECSILYASESITDVLGYDPSQVTNRSTFEFFHPDDLPFQRSAYTQNLKLDRAAMLAYVKVKNNKGELIGCECVFSTVYDVIVAATTIYKQGPRSEGRALAAPVVSRAFTPSVHDARYDMLAHLSSKFSSIAPNNMKEPRAAFILNRFTRSLSILYATHATQQILGVTASDMIGKSFLDCVESQCLDGAVDAIERAKQNDSVAYMRFAWKDPTASQAKTDDLNHQDMSELASSRDAEGGIISKQNSESSSSSSFSAQSQDTEETLQVEAILSCTSDGIIVIVRRAHTMAPAPPPSGLFAVPWSTIPLYPAPRKPVDLALSDSSSNAGSDTDSFDDGQHDFEQDETSKDILTSIQEVAVFVWGLQINEDMVSEFAAGTPGPEAKPCEEILEARRALRTHAKERIVERQRVGGRGRSSSPKTRLLTLDDPDVLANLPRDTIRRSNDDKTQS